MDYAERQRPITLPAPLVRELWAVVKAARDEARNDETAARNRAEAFDRLLVLLKDVGGADHLPTLEEAQAAWRGENT
jgi:hypothetical protein